jgi:diketogulonate reductase-like aldo/keto reductase
MMLLHSPKGEGKGEGRTMEAWRALERMKEDGRVRSIGVSNFTLSDLKTLLCYCKVVPSVNQIHMSPYCIDPSLIQYCNDNGITLVAHSILSDNRPFNDPKMSALSKRYKKSPAQLCIRWCIQHHIVALVKSTSKTHIKQNLDVFTTTSTGTTTTPFAIMDEDMQLLDQFDDIHATPAKAFMLYSLQKGNI